MRLPVLKVLAITFMVAPLIAAVGSGCSGKGAPKVTFDQLFSDPETYNNRIITIEGFYFFGFEYIVLCENLEYLGDDAGYFFPSGREIWVEEEGIYPEAYDALYQQRTIERYGKVRMTGKFEYGEDYGHFGLWNMQIMPTETIILPWTPPES